MKTKSVLTVVAAAAIAVFAQGTFAQASAPTSRAAVKAETKAAEKSGALTPAGVVVCAFTAALVSALRSARFVVVFALRSALSAFMSAPSPAGFSSPEARAALAAALRSARVFFADVPTFSVDAAPGP